MIVIKSKLTKLFYTGKLCKPGWCVVTSTDLNFHNYQIVDSFETKDKVIHTLFELLKRCNAIYERVE